MEMPAILTILAIVISAALTTGHAVMAARRRPDRFGLVRYTDDPPPPWATALGGLAGRRQ